MRDINRSRMAAAARSRRVSPDELREARNRVKEIDSELRSLELSQEAKRGEDREQRYERVLRLREMRSEFTAKYPSLEEAHGNSLVLAALMTILTILTCAFCAGGFYFGYNALTYNPGPSSVATSFWSDVQSQSYQDAYSNMLGPSLRGQITLQQFLTDAQQADTDYGPVVSVTLTSPIGNDKSNAKLVYTVTRKKKGYTPTVYQATIQMVSIANVWGLTDLGASIYPTLGGVKPVPGSATPSPSATP
ncbi:MAG TPA: hypothetical protein VF808_07360 [Ktedonobacterales bacterium]